MKHANKNKNIQTHYENSIIQVREKHYKLIPDNFMAYVRLQQYI